MQFSEKGKKKGKKMLKKGKIFENLGKNIQSLKIFWKRAGDCVQLSHACNKLLEKALASEDLSKYINTSELCEYICWKNI